MCISPYPFTHGIISVIACVTTITSLQNQEHLLVWLWFWDLHWEERWESFPSSWSPAYAYSTVDLKDCKWNYKHACIHIFLRIETKSLMACCSYCFVRVITACLHANHIIAIVKLLAVFIEYVEGRHKTILGMLLLIRTSPEYTLTQWYLITIAQLPYIEVEGDPKHQKVS